MTEPCKVPRVTHFTLPTDRLGVISDVHERVRTLEPIFAAFEHAGIDTVVQLGDLALPNARSGPAVTHDERQLSYIRRRAEAHGIHDVICLRGNHDHMGLLNQREEADGFVRLSRRLRFAPRTAIATTPSGARLALVSGAGSVDRSRRPSGRWFADEALSDAERTALVADAAGTIDLVFAHDAPGTADDTALARRLATSSRLWERGDLAYAQHENTYLTRLIADIARHDGATVISGHHHLRHDAHEVLHGVPLRTIVLDETYYGGTDAYLIVDVTDPRHPSIHWPERDGQF